MDAKEGTSSYQPNDDTYTNGITITHLHICTFTNLHNYTLTHFCLTDMKLYFLRYG